MCIGRQAHELATKQGRAHLQISVSSMKVWFNVLMSPLSDTIRMHGLNPRERYGLIYNTMSVDGEPTPTHHYRLVWDPLTLTSPLHAIKSQPFLLSKVLFHTT